MKRINPLIIIPSPRDIIEFKNAVSLLRYDKLWLKYYNEDQAYSLARYWFLEHTEYTHLIILPDDLIVTNTDIQRLIDNAAFVQAKVISGWCNVDSTSNLSTVTLHVPPDPPYGIQAYRFATLADMAGMTFERIVKVGFTSFALSLIDREIVEQVEFRNLNNTLTDLCFSRDLHSKSINQWVDTGVRLKHLKVNDDDTQRSLLVGKKISYMMFEPKRKGNKGYSS